MREQAEPGRQNPGRKGNKMNESMIKELEAKGFKRWQKGNMDRLYVNAANLGLNCEYYKTGNVMYAEFCGETVSNCEARRMKASKTYIDVHTGKAYSDNNTLRDKVNEILSNLEGVC